MADAAIDHESRRNALDEARSKDAQMPNAQPSHPGDFNVPTHGAAEKHAGAPSRERGDNYSQNPPSGNHAENLADARKGGLIENVKAAKELSKIATPMSFFSLLKQINFIGDIPYVAALVVALLKDLLDPVLAATVILPIVLSVLCTIFIFMMMLLVGASGKKKGMSKLLSKIGILGVGGIADSFPGLDFLPIETMAVAGVYVMELVERKIAAKK